jgi:hypothetical protein
MEFHLFSGLYEWSERTSMFFLFFLFLPIRFVCDTWSVQGVSVSIRHLQECLSGVMSCPLVTIMFEYIL